MKEDYPEPKRRRVEETRPKSPSGTPPPPREDTKPSRPEKSHPPPQPSASGGYSEAPPPSSQRYRGSHGGGEAEYGHQGRQQQATQPQPQGQQVSGGGHTTLRVRGGSQSTPHTHTYMSNYYCCKCAVSTGTVGPTYIGLCSPYRRLPTAKEPLNTPGGPSQYQGVWYMVTPTRLPHPTPNRQTICWTCSGDTQVGSTACSCSTKCAVHMWQSG